MKKIIAIVAVVCVVCVAGAAFAQNQQKSRVDPRQQAQVAQRQDNQKFQHGNFGCPCYDGRGYEGRGFCYYGRGPQQGMGPRGINWQPMPFNGSNRPDDNRDFGRGEPRDRARFAPDMNPEIRAKVADIAKLHIDLEEALSSRPINKAKALDVHAKIQKLEQEVEAWRFAQRLDRMEAFQKQQELNRNVRPAPPAPAAPKEEAKPEAEAPAE